MKNKLSFDREKSRHIIFIVLYAILFYMRCCFICDKANTYVKFHLNHMVNWVARYGPYKGITEMNREIASAPKKSEANFCERRATALSRPRHRTVHTPPDWLLKRVYGAEWGKREKSARCTCTERVYVGAARRSARNRPAEHFYYTCKLTDFLSQNYQTQILNHNPSPKGGR